MHNDYWWGRMRFFRSNNFNLGLNSFVKNLHLRIIHYVCVNPNMDCYFCEFWIKACSKKKPCITQLQTHGWTFTPSTFEGVNTPVSNIWKNLKRPFPKKFIPPFRVEINKLTCIVCAMDKSQASSNANSQVIMPYVFNIGSMNWSLSMYDNH